MAIQQTFHINIKGKRVVATYTPARAKRNGSHLFATQHWEFRTAGAGPISETGYRSHFVNGTWQQLGLTNQNIRRKTIKMATLLASEYKGKTHAPLNKN